MQRRPWWQTAVIYQIYPRSFSDSDGDGVGDLDGIRQRLDHLEWLGVDAVWLSPIYPSPMADGGYDVSDHCDVDPTFGDLADFDRLLMDSHERGLRVLLDWVPNHTSEEHPWFVDSRAGRDSRRRDWYFWRDGRDGGPPNNWLSAFGGRAWTWDDGSGQWYLHLFLPEQPDLNWANPQVEEAMHGVLRFWLDRGVDGFRADVVHLIGKDQALPDQPDELAHRDLVGVHDHPSTHALLRRIRKVLDSYPGDRAMVGEVNLGSAPLLAPYYGVGDELHMVFNFTLLRAAWRAELWAATIAASEQALQGEGLWPVWVLSNHDEPRHRTRYGGSEARARVAAVVLLTLRGTPFLYAGEELGLEDAAVAAAEAVDPAGRDGCRAPIPWTSGNEHGWPVRPWLPWPPDAAVRSVEAQRADADSILHLYRRLLTTRRASDALRAGSWRLLDTPSGVLAYERDGDDPRRVLANFADEPADFGLAGGWMVEVATSARQEGKPYGGRLAALEAVVLRRGAQERG
ncbi:MAG TPA: alpha-amylase family glycosyl hydrolase [Acidimicrobiia bacterium]|nr:alpha-amylase family glycosyl hydrolase [Acidimicrobiia bacterium]